ncbi:MAG: hypothetical protein AMR96_04395 [Candidatus Adiutrix intracellularis]|nr:MAG: hypothetical protein AMR96_04395 [Candidatus Adiutrix intracellularis]
MSYFTATWSDWQNMTHHKRQSFYAWRDELTLFGRIGFLMASAAFIGLCAQIKLVLPLTPVPLTLQTFAVATVAVTSGGLWGTLATVVYIALATLGLPWLAGSHGGWAVITGSTGGYIVGFILMATFIGRFTDKPTRCAWLPTWAALFAADVFLILIPGTLWLWFNMEADGPLLETLGQAFTQGVVPFILADIWKSGATSLIVAWLGRR